MLTTCILLFHCVVYFDKCCNFCENESLAESVSPHDFAKRSSLVISKQNNKKLTYFHRSHGVRGILKVVNLLQRNSAMGFH